MTHKPNILALNFTHQNKDEKNFVDTVVLLGVLTGQKLAMGFMSSGASPLCGTLLLALGVAEGPGGRVAVTAHRGKEEWRGPPALTA